MLACFSRKADKPQKEKQQPSRERRDSGSDKPPPSNLLAKVPVNFTSEQLDEHMAAYRDSRYYQATNPENHATIFKEGLDPKRRGQGNGAEAVSNPANVENAKKDPAVFLGGDMTTSRYYNSQAGVPRNTRPLRAFLTKAQHNDVGTDPADVQNLAYMYRQPVAPDTIMKGSFGEQSPEKLDAVFDAVRSHYPDGGSNVTVADVKARHMEAIRQRRTTHRAEDIAKRATEYTPQRRYQIPDLGYESD